MQSLVFLQIEIRHLRNGEVSVDKDILKCYTW